MPTYKRIVATTTSAEEIETGLAFHSEGKISVFRARTQLHPSLPELRIEGPDTPKNRNIIDAAVRLFDCDVD